MQVSFHKHFIKASNKLPSRVQNLLDEKIAHFINHPSEKELRNHKLHGKYKGYRSIDITGDYRAIYYLLSENEAFFIYVGSHAQLYR